MRGASDRPAHPADELSEAVTTATGVLRSLASLLEPNPDLMSCGGFHILMQTAADRLERARLEAERYWRWRLYFGPMRPKADLAPVRMGARPEGEPPPAAWFEGRIQDEDRPALGN